MGRLHNKKPLGQWLDKAMGETGVTAEEIYLYTGLGRNKLNRILRGDRDVAEVVLLATEYIKLARLFADRLQLPVEWCLTRMAEGLGLDLHRENEPHYMTPVDDPRYRSGRR